MKEYFEATESIEVKEEMLRLAVSELSDEKRHLYYQHISDEIKDPDTYAVLTWSLIGGFHHLYLKKYPQFIVEFTVLIICIIALVFGVDLALWGIVTLAVYELPQLFFSQKIARLYNLRVSERVYDSLKNTHL
ncbi:hypothetical protein [Vibrio salinus]|uniref:hypothetical protein n=1 Tax=Vibrio salinus TaxID=2899784 RepID=UPI001E4E7173|nr:hypothetical protein [Vibrio salinus]MCE0495866.1 hypothetical protein [Vibrio salinus]